MSYPYPQDRHRDRKEKGDQPYKDAKEAMAQQDVVAANQASDQNAPDIGSTATDGISEEMEVRLRRVNEEVEAQRGKRSS